MHKNLPLNLNNFYQLYMAISGIISFSIQQDTGKFENLLSDMRVVTKDRCHNAKKDLRKYLHLSPVTHNTQHAHNTTDFS